MEQHPFDAEAAPFVARTLERLADELGPEAITPAFCAVFRRWPRYRFVQRYSVAHRAWYDVARGQAGPHLQRLCGPGPIIVKDDVSTRWIRTLSQLPPPAIAARFLQLLKLRAGDRVLEIGSGSGWMLALMADIVGPQGQVVGIEIDPEIAAQARRRLAALGLANVEIVAGDAAVALPPGRRFERIVISAGIQDLPRTVFSAAAEDAVLVAPAAAPGRSWRLYGWARHGNVFHAAASVSSNCPPLQGRLAVEDPPFLEPQDLPFVDLLQSEPRHRSTCFAAQATQEQRYEAKHDFCTYLSLRFGRSYEWLSRGKTAADGKLYVAHYDRRTSSVGVLGDDGFVAYGADDAWQQIQAAWKDWIGLGRPKLGKFMLDIHPAESRPAASSTCWVHQHRDSVFVWRLK